MTDPFANFSNTLSIGQKALKDMLEPAKLIKIQPLNYWSMSTFTDRAARPPVDSITAISHCSPPESLDCRGMKVRFE